MTFIETDQLERTTGKKLYDYQKEAMNKIFDCLERNPSNYNLLYQLPTGGGKTVIFTEIAKRYINISNKKVLVLTHRIELCNQTSKMLGEFNVNCKIIDSKVKELPDQDDFQCFVAMVETLNNRLKDDMLDLKDIGLVIVDEAHYNSFRKLFPNFNECIVLGVTATPLSSNINLPMFQNYKELIVGDSISSLIKKGFLAKATTYCYDVGLSALKIGANGDYTVKSSELLYSDYPMLQKLLYAYEEKSLGKKTLIFNNGINTSLNVYDTFTKIGYNIKHLDNTNTPQERREILDWFKHTPNAILTSVGILTTGFDEPTVESIILNRATRSLTLYHQMIGRGSRVLPNKKEFTVLDLGNNAARFGPWDTEMDWHEIFRNPDFFLSNIFSDEEIERKFRYTMPDDVREKFKNSIDIHFDVDAVYQECLKKGLKPKVVLDKSIEQHKNMCVENSEDLMDARVLARLLKDDIAYRVRLFSYNICKSTENYLKWLSEDYFRQLSSKINQHYVD
ncbi:MAG: DEAD/DEAH box helicase [Flavobacteriales bacterium CG18_big_fil_WC_8_21_14_2_50_32_9]|nr:DEAD/DEAH box helicase family protein [Flavobacteriales bacterium]PIQ14541.1 MAG: DEAD/DEAH box helicase [Flavobacteriales bacterium CG18_big_fil_WC_8_21_14_2_50_32_9]PJC61292.1 MAG: DEAD/DEAH box helicase [Flavobacteriales bacterium CG_4_9_14_0_2_um_filter_32_27]